VGRLFAGTPWDRPPRCERCGALEAECQCPPVANEPEQRPPREQTAWIKVEKRAKDKVVTIVRNLDPARGALDELATTLKQRCGSGGTVKDGAIELQGDHLATAEAVLTALGYGVKRR
jgi:translation initiation factor 1